MGRGTSKVSNTPISKVSSWGFHGQGGLSDAEANKVLKIAGINELSNSTNADIRVLGDKTRIKIDDDSKEVIVVLHGSEKEVYIDLVAVKNKGQGQGTKILNEIKNQAKRQGYKRLSLYAAGDANSSGYNGYYSMARFGFNANIPSSVAQKAKNAGFNAKTIQDLMKTEKGRKWWRENGTGYEGYLDL